MIRKGLVVSKEKNGVLVCFERLAACHGCNACGRETKKTSALVHGQAEIGDVVSVEMPEAQVLKASLLVYLLPLLGFLLGLYLGSLFFAGSELAMVVGGLIMLSLSALGLRAADLRLGTRHAWQAHIVGIESQDDAQRLSEPV